MRSNSGQTQQHYQPSSQQQQYQQQKQRQSPSLNNVSQIKMQARQGSYSQQPQRSYQSPQQQQQYAQASYQNTTDNDSFGGTAGANSNHQFSYDGEYMDPNQYALSARRAMDDTSSFGNQPMYGQFGRR